MLATAAVLTALFVVGAIAGTWIDHAADAIPADRAWFGLPACANCAQPWRGLALLPVAGWLVARRCPKCGEPISPLRPLTEAAGGLLFALAYLRFGPGPTFVSTAAFGVLLLVILRIDWRHHLIFTNTILAGLLLAFGYAAIGSREPNGLLWAVVAAAAAAALFLLLYVLALAVYRRRALGFGDVLLAALLGAMTGPDVARALVIGMVLAAGGGLLLVALKVRTMRDFIPYGAYLCAGTIVTLLLR